MFCGNCGAKNEEGLQLCANCGTPLEVTPDTAQEPIATDISPEETVKPARRKKKGKTGLFVGLGVVGGVGILAAAGTVLLAAILIIVLCFGSSPKSIALDYVKAAFEPDMAAYLDLIHKDVIEESFSSKREQREWVENANENMEDYLTLLEKKYDDYKITYKVTYVDSVNKGYLEEIQEDYEDEYDLKVKKAKEVTVEVTLKSDGEKITAKYVIMTVKIGNKWYVDTGDTDSPYYLIWELLYGIEE